MARLVGFIGNRPDLGARVIELEGRALDVRRRTGVTPGWGVGFYQAGEILLKRRPIDDRDEVRPADITRDVRADTLVAHVRLATVGAPRTENTHPFRYRQWLFANTGTVEAFARLRGRLAEQLPQFLHRDVRGETDSELLFHLFLSFLHDAGQLDRPAVEPSAARTALRGAMALVDGLCAEEGAPPTALNVIVTNPEYLIAVHAGTASSGGTSAAASAEMGYRVFQGQRDLERLFGDGGLGRMRIPDYATSRLTLVASDFDDGLPPGWTAVPQRAIVTITRSDDPVIESL
ncbi:Glutamine amidotransferases class-II [Minicystis rosea]|nr:Glutamine amidotransferases class-II [Minicystis rosea]